MWIGKLIFNFGTGGKGELMLCHVMTCRILNGKLAQHRVSVRAYAPAGYSQHGFRLGSTRKRHRQAEAAGAAAAVGWPRLERKAQCVRQRCKHLSKVKFRLRQLPIAHYSSQPVKESALVRF